MRLNFKTHFPWPGPAGAPSRTRFAEQILNAWADLHDQVVQVPGSGYKYHTLRRVKERPRFREGMTLQMTTGPRFKQNVFMELPCTGVQLVHINALHREFMAIDGPPCYSWQLIVQLDGPDGKLLPLKQLAANDGLELHQFTRWFLLDVLTHGPGLYELVHWTDIRYA